MRKIKSVLILVLFGFVLNGGIFAQDPKQEPKEEQKPAQNQEKKKEDDLARLGLVPFEDRTGSENYSYLSESLTDAINESLQKNFSYDKISYEEIKKAVFNAQQAIIKKNGTLKKMSDPKKDEEWKEIVKNISIKKNLNADILIYGNYRYDEEKNEIVFAVNLYLGLIDTNIQLDEIHNAVDSTIFQATNKVAGNIVWEINNMVDKAAKQAEKAAPPAAPGEAPAPEKKPAKKAITKAVVQGPYNWPLKKFAMSGYIGLAGFGNTGTNEMLYMPIPEFTIRFWPIPALQLTLLAGLNVGLEMPGQNLFPLANLALMAGYSTSFLALHWYAEAGPMVSFLTGVSSDPRNNTMYIGPKATTGLDLLVSEAYAFGIKFSAQYLFGGSAPVFGVDGSITASLVF